MGSLTEDPAFLAATFVVVAFVIRAGGCLTALNAASAAKLLPGCGLPADLSWAILVRNSADEVDGVEGVGEISVAVMVCTQSW
jgi:hypothetical protein